MRLFGDPDNKKLFAKCKKLFCLFYCYTFIFRFAVKYLFAVSAD